jgi:hypothetical protein
VIRCTERISIEEGPLIRKLLAATSTVFALAGALRAQDCKAKFAVGYTDGKKMQTGLTQEQRKYWDKEGGKKFKGMCLDFGNPDYFILWSVGLTGQELAESGVGNFNRARETGQSTTTPNPTGTAKISTTDSRWTDSTLFIGQSSQVRAKANYWIMDLSKNPATVIRAGQGYRLLPEGLGVANSPGEKVNAQDMSSTVPDETEAMENALKWLKKEKKI